MTSRICPCRGCTHHAGSCPTITKGGRCLPCGTALNAARGTRQQRGYDATHDTERRRWARIIRRRPIACARGCGTLIHHGDDWDLGHNDERTAWTGPECRPCNRGAGGRAGAAASRS